jgi:hypothetical protein
MTARLKAARLTDSSAGNTIDDAIAALEASLAELLGVTLDQDYTGALSLGGSLPQRAHAYHNATQSVSPSTLIYPALNSEAFDTDAMHDNTTNNSRITFKTAGTYLVGAHMLITTTAAGSFQLDLLLNRTKTFAEQRCDIFAGGIAQAAFSLPGVIVASANDYAEMRLNFVLGGTCVIQAGSTTNLMNCSLWAQRIG